MSKKIKCCDCENLMEWEIPFAVNDDNYEYCLSSLLIAKNFQPCGVYGRGVRPKQERYCKYFEEKKEKFSSMQKDIENLEKLIAEYEKQKSRSDHFRNRFNQVV